jgi:hypothetical protein
LRDALTLQADKDAAAFQASSSIAAGELGEPYIAGVIDVVATTWTGRRLNCALPSTLVTGNSIPGGCLSTIDMVQAEPYRRQCAIALAAGLNSSIVFYGYIRTIRA